MLTYDVPFLPDDKYVRFLEKNLRSIHAVHFGLHRPGVSDARHRQPERPLEEMIAGLRRLRGVKKYALCNSRFHDPGLYGSSKALRAVIDPLVNLGRAGVLSGLVYADHYLLQALSDTAPEVCSRLEAVPSVNCGLDSFDAVRACLDYIGMTRFRPPSKIVLDRSLNRSLDTLVKLTGRIRETWPGLRVEILANEGCLPRCPFKLSHDAHIAHAHLACGTERNFVTNERLGCARYFTEHPHLILASPFIRPEDVHWLNGLADGIKICGRTRGPKAMHRIVSAYLSGTYRGNLLELLDAMEHLADRYDLSNLSLPDDFFITVSRCSRRCDKCDYCSGLAARSLLRREVPLKKMFA